MVKSLCLHDLTRTLNGSERRRRNNDVFARNIGLAEVFVMLFVQIVLALRVGALKRQGRALGVPKMISGEWTALENTLAELERAATRCEREASAQNGQQGE